MKRMTRRILFAASAALAVLALTPQGATAEDKSIIVQSTTSTQNSGLYDYLLPIFEKKTGIKVHVVAVGTGQAIKNAKNCDGDVLFVHAKASEEKFVKEGGGVKRFDVMYNDFIILGPPADPAKINGLKDATKALEMISKAGALFASRGDNSGTDKKEKALWKAAKIEPAKASGKWYRETGSGMGATLNAAKGMGAYVMSDRATWINFKNKGDYKIVVEGDKRLFNQYGIMLVNPKHCAKVKAKEGQTFVDWVLSKEGQNAIAAYHVDGKQLFFPNAHMM